MPSINKRNQYKKVPPSWGLGEIYVCSSCLRTKKPCARSPGEDDSGLLTAPNSPDAIQDSRGEDSSSSSSTPSTSSAEDLDPGATSVSSKAKWSPEARAALLQFVEEHRYGDWHILSHHRNVGLVELNPWVDVAATYVNTIAPMTNASGGSVVSEIRRLAKDYGDFDPCFEQVGPPSLIADDKRLETLRQVTRKLHDSRRHGAKQSTKLLDIVTTAEMSADEKLRELEAILRRSSAQLQTNLRASEGERVAGMSIEGMDDIFKKWFFQKSSRDRNEFLEDLVKENFKKQSESPGRRDAEPGFIASCIQGAINLEEAECANIIKDVAVAASTNVEYVKASKAVRAIIANWGSNALKKGPTGARHSKTVMELMQTVKHESNKKTTAFVSDNFAAPGVRRLQQILQESRASTESAGLDKAAIKHLAKHERETVFVIGADESKVKDISKGNQGESDWGEGYGKFGLTERLAYSITVTDTRKMASLLSLPRLPSSPPLFLYFFYYFVS